jgi:hypothetical protein
MYRVAAFQVPVAGFLLMVGMGRWLGVGRLGIGRLGVGQVVRCRAGGFDGLRMTSAGGFDGLRMTSAGGFDGLRMTSAGGFDGLQGEHPRSIKSCFSGLFTFPKTTLK